jgi:hypothetical protein
MTLADCVPFDRPFNAGAIAILYMLNDCLLIPGLVLYPFYFKQDDMFVDLFHHRLFCWIGDQAIGRSEKEGLLRGPPTSKLYHSTQCLCLLTAKRTRRMQKLIGLHL